MRRVKDQLQDLSIQTRLVLLILLFLGIPLLVLGPYWYGRSTATIEDNAVRSSLQHIEQVNERLLDYFQQLEKSTLPLLRASAIQQFLKAESPDEYDRYVMNSNIEKEVFNNLTYGRKDVLGVSIVTDGGSVVTNYQRKQALDAYAQYRTKLEQSDGRNFVIEGVRQFDYDIPVLTITRKITDVMTGSFQAMIIIDLNFQSISNILEHIQPGNGGFLWLVGPEDQVMYHPDAGGRGQPLQLASLPPLPNKAEGYVIDNTEAGKRLIIYHRSADTGLTLVAEVPIHELTGNLIQLRNVTIVIGMLLIGLVMAVLIAFTLSLTHSLTTLKRLMKRAELGDLNVRAPGHWTTEIRGLNNSFNKMVAEMKRLIDIVHISELKEKEVELRHMESVLHAAQSQINPHFLYNTLEMVNSFAMKSGAKQVSLMIHMIAKMFRYCIGNPQKMVKLEEEINHIMIYLQVQKERFDQLQVEIDVEAAAGAQTDIVRLCIQPVVENSFIHGYEKHLLHPTYIGIFGRERNGDYLLRIVDKGGGMPEATREQLEAAFRRNSVHRMLGEDKFHIRNIGLWNVHSRLRMTFGEPYGLTIHSSGASGTIVDIVLPLPQRPNRAQA